MRSGGNTWTFGGSGLIAVGALGTLRVPLAGTAGAAWLGVLTDVVYAAALIVLAIGLTREHSVVARRPLGVCAMAVLAFWPFATNAAAQILATSERQDGSGWAVLGYISLAVQAGAGLIAATQVARAGVVPSPWRWAPLWVMGVAAFAWAVPQLVITALGPHDVQLYAGLFIAMGTLAFMAGTLGLGIMLLILAARRQDTSTEVFRSA